MKAKLPILTTLRLALQGKTVTKILTVFLCAFSFALFALASTGYLYDKKDVYTRAVVNYAQETSGAVRITYQPASAMSGPMGQDAIASFEETGLSFAYYYGSWVSTDLYPATFASYQYDYVQFRDELTRNEQAAMGSEGEELAPKGASSPLVLNEEQGEAFGLRIAAGRYPETVCEIAVPDVVFEDFVRNGYVDNSANMMYLDKGCLEDGTPYRDPETGEYAFYRPNGNPEPLIPNDGDVFTGYHFFGLGNCGERETIESYDDLLGKEIMLYGNLETGVLDESGAYTAKIVGILDTSSAALEMVKSSPVYSDAWRETFFRGRDETCSSLILPSVSYGEARALVDVTLELLESYVASHGPYMFGQIGVRPVSDLIDFTMQFVDELAILVIGLGAGLLFGIFSVLLCWHLTTSSLNLKKRKIGVLRALGAGEADVRRIVLFEVLFVAICSFALALLLSLGVFYGIFYELFYIEQYGIAKLNFTGWNVLILAVFSFAVPLLSALVPLKRFLQKPIVDNISGNISNR